MRYLLLFKRLFKKKSYILMLLLVPLLVFALKGFGSGDNSIMTIGVYIPGDDISSTALKEEVLSEQSAIEYVFYNNPNQLKKAVENKSISEGWLVPEELDSLVEQLALNQIPSEKVQIVIREEGLSHLLGKEILCSRIYPSVAKKLLINYMSSQVYQQALTNNQLAEIEAAFNSFGLSDSLFKAGYLDDENVEDSTIILMPLRGMLSVWLMLCGLATSMYYLQDEKNGLFIWWKTSFRILRDVGYYAVAFIAPTVITIVSLVFSGTFTSVIRELLALLLYELTVILLSILLRVVLGNIRTIGMLTPALIIVQTILSPVFIDLKQLRTIQKCCPAFHYLSSIHDNYYLITLLIYAIFLWCLVVLFLKLPVKMGKIFKAYLL